MIKSIVITTVSGLVFHFGHLWLLQRFPYHPPPGATRWNLKQLERLYARVDSFSAYMMMASIPVLPFLCYVLLLGWRYLVYPNPGTPGMIMTPSWYYWTAVAVSAGWVMFLTCRPLVLRRVLGRRYAEFCLYRKWKSGRAIPVIYKVCGAFGVSSYCSYRSIPSPQPTRSSGQTVSSSPSPIEAP